LTVLVINKDLRAAFNGKIEITPPGNGNKGMYTQAQVFALDGSGASIRALPAAAITDNQIAYRLPPLSATLFVCRR
jgi:hypothetical protein